MKKKNEKQCSRYFISKASLATMLVAELYRPGVDKFSLFLF